jgi:hypothetical protein
MYSLFFAVILSTHVLGNMYLKVEEIYMGQVNNILIKPLDKFVHRASVKNTLLWILALRLWLIAL